MLKKHNSGNIKFFKKMRLILKDCFCFNCPKMRKTMTQRDQVSKDGLMAHISIFYAEKYWIKLGARLSSRNGI